MTSFVTFIIFIFIFLVLNYIGLFLNSTVDQEGEFISIVCAEHGEDDDAELKDYIRKKR